MNRGFVPRHVFALAALSAALGMAAIDLRAQDGGVDVNRGRAVYERHCLACHGVGGRGDGPEAASLRTKPANFHRAISMLKSDEELLRVIEYGVVFSPMHSWQGKLTEGELQDVLAYIRLLSRELP
jgi:mono/diheme cytochrome c family protein